MLIFFKKSEKIRPCNLEYIEKIGGKGMIVSQISKISEITYTQIGIHYSIIIKSGNCSVGLLVMIANTIAKRISIFSIPTAYPRVNNYVPISPLFSHNGGYNI